MLIDELIGTWHSWHGRFQTMMFSSFELREDHTGVIATRSVLSGEENMTFFWSGFDNSRKKLLINWPDSGAEIPDAEVNTEDDWEDIQCDFKMVATDVGSKRCLVQVINGKLTDSFLLPDSPLYKQNS